MLEMQIAIPQTRVFVFTAFPERSGSEEAEFLCLCSLVFTFPFPHLPLVDTTTSTAEEMVFGIRNRPRTRVGVTHSTNRAKSARETHLIGIQIGRFFFGPALLTSRVSMFFFRFFCL